MSVCTFIDVPIAGAADNLHLEAKRPELAKKEARMNTFQNWPSNAMQSPNDLAEAGLYYTGRCLLFLYRLL